MDPDACRERAIAEVGSDDFGPSSYRDGLEFLVASLRHEARLHDLGTAALESMVVTQLATRLRVTEWISHHPEVLDERIERPLFVLGLPRTGTTLLSYLLDRDPARRSLLRWEAVAPVPPPDAGTYTTDPRIAAAAESSAMLDALNPGFKAIHYEAPDGPTECVAVLAQDFKSLMWSTLAHIPGYDTWLLGCDETSAYEHHYRVLQLLQSGAPGRWALKSPHHCLALPALFARYPDARIVMTHRDPVTVCASVCSLLRSLGGTFSDADHRADRARHWPELLAVCTERVTAFRDEHGDERFLDVQYAELVADPLGTVARIYEHLGEELTPDVRARMRRYAAANPQGVHGRHDYDLDSLLLDGAAVRDRFSAYTDRLTPG